jgi:hypothetical protein
VSPTGRDTDRLTEMCTRQLVLPEAVSTQIGAEAFHGEAVHRRWVRT